MAGAVEKLKRVEPAILLGLPMETGVFVAVSTAAITTAFPGKASHSGCSIMLCLSPDAGNWQADAASVGPVALALLQAQFLFVPAPTCPEAAAGAARLQAQWPRKRQRARRRIKP
jgi:hypothetical protein